MKSRLWRFIRRRYLGGREAYQEQAFGIARRWSNAELRRVAPLFRGAIVNVSAWQDRDKEGGLYRDYFAGASSYHITNYGTDQGHLQNVPEETYLDLELDLDPALKEHYSTVFNHTTLEHVWDFRKGFSNLCALSSDAVIIVVPWLQPLHSDYGDFWRFSPQAIIRMFDEEGFSTIYLNWNDDPKASVYVFAIAVREPALWLRDFPEAPISPRDPKFTKLPKGAARSRVFD